MTEKEELVLATLTVGKKAIYEPVQVQKIFFLIDRNISGLINGPIFNFKPYDYGPFDDDVYRTLESLAVSGFIEIKQVIGKNWRAYCLTNEGLTEGSKILAGIDGGIKEYLEKVVAFVTNLSFDQLVSSIYKAYPDMKVNSVFGR